MADQTHFNLGDAHEEDVSYPHNVLAHDGEVIYHGAIFDQEEANRTYADLMDKIPWKHDEAFIYGKHIITARKVAWYGDRDYNYSYSGKTRTAMKWTPELLKIKHAAEQKTGMIYNSCLLNLYADGSQGMAWHSDDEKCLGKDTNIASMSFGAIRRFDFRHKATREKVSVILQSGSLLVMQGSTQTHWQHQIPKTTKVTTPRVNLTFRTMQF
jgi:alkylated DNA repair dioxygenase AlkB